MSGNGKALVVYVKDSSPAGEDPKGPVVVTGW
jgi:hypothetical protein